MNLHSLTKNELRATIILVNDCLENMGGEVPSDIHDDPFTWTDVKILVDNGYTLAEAKGTFSALDKKGIIDARGKEATVAESTFDMFTDSDWINTVNQSISR